MAPQRWPGTDASRVPYWVYTDPEVYAREQELIFGGPSWSYVALEVEIPNLGDFTQSTIGDKPVVVVRGKDGAINVLPNRCAHRGVQFCRDACGNADNFMCPYHQWTYNHSGRLIGVPFKKGVNGQGGMPSDFVNAEHSLPALAPII